MCTSQRNRHWSPVRVLWAFRALLTHAWKEYMTSTKIVCAEPALTSAIHFRPLLSGASHFFWAAQLTVTNKWLAHYDMETESNPHRSQIWLKSVAAERKGFPYDALQKIMDISKHGRLMLTGSLQWERNTPNGKTHRFAERLRYPAQILNRARYRTVQLWWRPRNVIFLTGSG